MSTTVGARPAVGAGTAGSLEDSTPYPWPWDGSFDPGRLALLVLDTAAGALPSTGSPWAVISTLADRTRRAGGSVIEIRTRRPAGSYQLPEPAPPRLDGASAMLTAAGWDGFYGTPLDAVLRSERRELLLLAGAWLEVSVHSTMRSANDRGYECLLVADACVSGDDDLRAGALSSIEMSGGIFGAVGTSAGVLRLLDDVSAAHQQEGS